MHWKFVINYTETVQEMIFPRPNFSFYHVILMYMFWDQLEINIIVLHKL